MNFEEYRRLQDDRFNDNVGTTFLEIILLSQLPFVLNFLSFVIVSKIVKVTSSSSPILEFICIFIPLILFITSLSDYLYKFYIFLCILLALIFLYVLFTTNIRRGFFFVVKRTLVTDDKLPCITNFRSIVNSFSVICILAADFTCFPKRYLKTSTYGYGLMDVGVGLYVMSNAFTNSHFNNLINKKRVQTVTFLKSTFKKVLPLLLIGIGRYVATTTVDYHQNISEYGVHWNFFISLSCLAIFNEILMFFVNKISVVYIFIVVLLTLYECVLSAGLKSWINNDSVRIGFLSSNKEGICSLIGYEVIYLCGLVIKHFLPRKGDNYKKYVSVAFKCTSGFLLFTFLTVVSEHIFGVSRKLANCGYTFFIISLSLLSLLNLILQDFLIHFLNISAVQNKKQVKVISSIIEAINYNGLLFFLIGNLLTGIINMCAHTLTINSFNSILIIMFYTILCCFSVVYLHKKNIRLR